MKYAWYNIDNISCKNECNHLSLIHKKASHNRVLEGFWEEGDSSSNCNNCVPAYTLKGKYIQKNQFPINIKYIYQ